YLQAAPLLKTDPAAALPKLERAVALCDCVPDAPRLQLAELLLQQGRLQAADAHLLRVLQQYPDNARASLGLARLSFERGECSHRLTHLHRCVAGDRTRKAARLLLAQAYERLGNPSAAEQEFRRAADLPNDAPWPDRFFDEVVQLRVGKQALLTRAEGLLN